MRAMLQANPNPSVLTVSPPDSKFTPRKEFLRATHHITSSFALLTIAGAGLVRVSSFPQDVVNALQHSFQHYHLLREFREDHHLHLTEFTLERKPWAATNSAASEKLFVRILSVIFRHGYSILSTVDRGRDHDERLCIAFSRPDASMPPPRVPFAVSFPSSKVLRVVSPPLQSTPAILQSVRSAWTRGKVSEKKVDDCYEFKLKGYRWLPNGCPAVDPVVLVQSLLNFLDTHAFTLVTSLNLSGGRSRFKDLWIFAGQSEDVSSISSVSLGSRADSNRVSTPVSPVGPDGPSSSATLSHVEDSVHWRVSPPGLPKQKEHVRSPLEPHDSYRHSFPESWGRPSLLHKQPPVSKESPPASINDDTPVLRKKASSSIGSVDMTGIGTMGNHRSVSQGHHGMPPATTESAPNASSHVQSLPFGARPQESSLQNYHAEVAKYTNSWTPEVLYQNPMINQDGRGEDDQDTPDDTPRGNKLSIILPTAPFNEGSYGSTASPSTPTGERSTRQVPLGPRMIAQKPSLPSTPFRDSAFSSNSNRSYDSNTNIPSMDTRAMEDYQAEKHQQENVGLRKSDTPLTFPSTHPPELVDRGFSHDEGDTVDEDKPSNQPSNQTPRPLRRSSPMDRRHPAMRETVWSGAGNMLTRHQLSPVEEKTLQEAMSSSPTRTRPRPRSHDLASDLHEAIYDNIQAWRKETGPPRFDPPAKPSPGDGLRHDRDPQSLQGDSMNVAGFQHAMHMHSQPHLSATYGNSLDSKKREKAVSDPSTSSRVVSGGLGGGWVLVNFGGLSKSSPCPSPSADYGKLRSAAVVGHKPVDMPVQRRTRESDQPPAPPASNSPFKNRFFGSKSRDKLLKGGK